jgi:MerR family mercuric resistance operon transcriptional regulator
MFKLGRRQIRRIRAGSLAGYCIGKVDHRQTSSGVNYGIRSYHSAMKRRLAGKPVPLEAPSPLTIGRLAKAAGVGVETVRYYQSRGLLRVPAANGGFRIYPAATVHRIAFIKRAQVLGFTLDEVRSLLDLEDGRNRRAIQSVAQARLEQIEDKLADLHRMRGALSDLLHRCRQTGPAQVCPIIETLAGRSSPV